MCVRVHVVVTFNYTKHTWDERRGRQCDIDMVSQLVTSGRDGMEDGDTRGAATRIALV